MTRGNPGYSGTITASVRSICLQNSSDEDQRPSSAFHRPGHPCGFASLANMLTNVPILQKSYWAIVNHLAHNFPLSAESKLGEVRQLEEATHRAKKILVLYKMKQTLNNYKQEGS